MPQITATASAVIDAPAVRVYDILADYRHGHPRILPPQFSDFVVESGGVGTGTVIRFKMTMAGATRSFRAAVSEPEPGRVLVESGLESGEVTTFVVDPVDGGSRCNVIIRTEWTAPGLGGWLQRLVGPRMLRRVYAQELQNLARVAAEESSAG